jgi:ABC-2 type transport system ATP-binding protein
MTNAIETRGLGYRAGRHFEIRDLDLNVPVGSIYGFLGPNGSGKTTTIRLLLGMVRAARGESRLLGHAVPGELPLALARIGYVPERPHVYPLLTVSEALRHHAAFHPAWDAAWADELRAQFGLRPDHRVGRLSKGEAGKLVILLALAQRPELLVLDEPTDGLDPMVRRDVITAVLEYVSECGATVFVSSHLVHELERVCDWVGVLDHGRLVAELPILHFKNGVKRLRLSGALPAIGHAPFSLLSREPDGGGSGESWVVQGWQDGMHRYFEASGASVREVVDLDLEEVFVELLRSSREVVS